MKDEGGPALPHELPQAIRVLLLDGRQTAGHPLQIKRSPLTIEGRRAHRRAKGREAQTPLQDPAPFPEMPSHPRRLSYRLRARHLPIGAISTIALRSESMVKRMRSPGWRPLRSPAGFTG